MGFADADVLMARVAEAARSIDWVSERFWRRVDRALRSQGPSRRRPAHAWRSRCVPASPSSTMRSQVDLDDAGVDQSLVLRVAAAAAHAGYPISRRALLTLSATISRRRARPWHERTRRRWSACSARAVTSSTRWRRLERYELFSRMLPEWRHVRSLPQRNAFHTFTVDRHLLQTVANASEFVRDVARPGPVADRGTAARHRQGLARRPHRGRA